MADGKAIGQLAYFKWQDGAVIGAASAPAFALPIFLGALLNSTKPVVLVPSDGLQYTSVVAVTIDEFKAWPQKLSANPGPQPFASSVTLAPLSDDDIVGKI